MEGQIFGDCEIYTILYVFPENRLLMRYNVSIENVFLPYFIYMLLIFINKMIR